MKRRKAVKSQAITTMKCDWTQKISLLIDGELPPSEARETERHLDLCAGCRTARADFLLLRRQIADYPLDLDAFARQRALKRILAAASGGTGFVNETAAPTHGRRFAGVFGLPRLSPAGLAALLLLLFGVAVGVVSLMNSRRARVELVTNALTDARVGNSIGNSNGDSGGNSISNSNNNSSAATPKASPPVPDNLTASASKPDDVKQAAGNNQKRAGVEASKGEGGGAAGGRASGGGRAGANARRIETASGEVPGGSATTPKLNRPPVAAPVAESARNDVAVVDGESASDADGIGASGADDAGEDVAARRDTQGAEGESKTARHVEQAQLLLRSFRNARPADAGRRASSDLAYEKQRSKKLLYQNIVLRREAASRGNLPVESLLDSLEPILIDIANLPDRPAPADVREINERMRRKNLVAMLQISAVESASARSY